MASLLKSSKVIPSCLSLYIEYVKMKLFDFISFIFAIWSCLIRVFDLVAHINQMACSYRLHELPLCALVGILGVIIDTPAIAIVAFCKMPLMLIKGWHRLLQDLVTSHGRCLEAACVPFAGLALAFWPFVVVASALTAFTCSPLVGLYAAVIVYQVCMRCLRYFSF